jgi:electron transfer flavoprotein beta subunit
LAFYLGVLSFIFNPNFSNSTLKMKILVCLSHVPDTTSKINFVNDNTKLDSAGVQFIIGPYDDYALARAIELKESLKATVTVLNVGLADTEPTIRKALAIGADDAIRINAEPTDSYFVAFQIAEQAKVGGGYDLILMGRESIDYNGGVVHSLVGELLGLPSISPVMKLDIEGNLAKMAREIEGGKEYLEVSLPLVAGCQEPIAEWKIPNMRGIMSARTKPLAVIESKPVDSGVKLRKFELPAAKGAVKMVPAENVKDLVSMLKNEAKVL